MPFAVTFAFCVVNLTLVRHPFVVRSKSCFTLLKVSFVASMSALVMSLENESLFGLIALSGITIPHALYCVPEPMYVCNDARRDSQGLCHSVGQSPYLPNPLGG